MSDISTLGIMVGTIIFLLFAGVVIAILMDNLD